MLLGGSDELGGHVAGRTTVAGTAELRSPGKAVSAQDGATRLDTALVALQEVQDQPISLSIGRIAASAASMSAEKLSSFIARTSLAREISS